MATKTTHKPIKTDPPPTPEPSGDQTALETQGTKELAEFDFGEFAGHGMASIPATLIKLPFIMLVQKNTPGTDKPGDPLNGKIGYIFNPATGKTYAGDVGLEAVIIEMRETYVEKTDKDSGGKFVDKHDPLSDVVREGMKRTEAYNKAEKAKGKENGNPLTYGKVMAPTGKNMLVQTFECLAVLRDPETGERFGGVIPFKSTSIPAISKWSTGVLGNRFLPNGKEVGANVIPLFSYNFKLTTFREDRGSQSWYKFIVTPTNMQGGEDAGNYCNSISQKGLYLDAIEQIKAIKEGRAQIDESTRDAGDDGVDHAPAGGPSPAAKRMDY